jgi:hypothetical protein
VEVLEFLDDEVGFLEEVLVSFEEVVSSFLEDSTFVEGGSSF